MLLLFSLLRPDFLHAPSLFFLRLRAKGHLLLAVFSVLSATLLCSSLRNFSLPRVRHLLNASSPSRRCGRRLGGIWPPRKSRSWCSVGSKSLCFGCTERTHALTCTCGQDVCVHTIHAYTRRVSTDSTCERKISVSTQHLRTQHV